MSAIANVAINDGKGTPQLHTFKPVLANGERAVWQELPASGLQVGANKLLVSIRPASKDNAGHKVQIKLNLPTAASVTAFNGVQSTQVVREAVATVEFLLPKEGTLAERQDLRKLIYNALADASMIAAIEGLESFY